jgi:hypothetical protein
MKYNKFSNIANITPPVQSLLTSSNSILHPLSSSHSNPLNTPRNLSTPTMNLASPFFYIYFLLTSISIVLYYFHFFYQYY